MTNISYKEQYELLLRSGIFWEIYPEFAGQWVSDKNKFIADRKKIAKNQKQ